jgi:transposase, IS5 family
MWIDMKNQVTFSDVEYENRKRISKREAFLNTMNQILPLSRWIALIEPYYPSGKRGRPTRGIEIMLRMYLLQLWFSLSDEGIEDAIYDSYCMRKFMGIDFISETVPDATTLLKFRHLLEEHGIGKAIFDDIKMILEQQGLIMHGGTIVDATLIEAPSSTKNESGKRDPEMHQTKKGNQWHFGMKVHIGTDAGTGYVHSVTGTSANVHDLDEAAKLIREDDEVVYGDSGYTGIEKRKEIVENEHLSEIDYRIAMRPSRQKTTDAFHGFNWEKEIEHRKSSVRCKVEHAFLIVKRDFGCRKVSYRGIKKNLNRFHMLFACANLLMYARSGRTETLNAA